MYPTILKSNFIESKNLIFRDVTENDAEFILRLRLNPSKKKFISNTSSKIEDQIKWINQYKSRDNEAYFIITNKEQKRYGCIRLYDSREYSYCWGSWLLEEGLPPLIALESAVNTYNYGIQLGFKEVRLDVRKNNTLVKNFHEKFAQAIKIDETENDIYYLVKEDSIRKLLKKYNNLLN